MEEICLEICRVNHLNKSGVDNGQKKLVSDKEAADAKDIEKLTT